MMRMRFISILLGIASGLVGCGGLDKTRDTTAPAVPAGFRLVGAGDGQAFFRWDASPEPDLGEYVLQRADSAGASFETVIRLSENEYTDQHLEYEQTYYYRLQAGDRAGNYSAFTDPIDVTPLNLSSPQRPRGVIARGRNLPRIPLVGITLRWEPNAESDLLLYRVYRGVRVDFAIADSTLVDSTDAPTYFDAEVETDRRYYYSIEAMDRGGKRSLPSIPVDDILLGMPALLSPKGDVEISQPFDFQWQPLASAEGYRIYLGTTAFSPAIWQSGLVAGDVTRIRYLGPPLAPRRAYYWWLAAHSRRTDVLVDGTEVESDLNSLSEYGRFVVR
jgi:hypothetical protein